MNYIPRVFLQRFGFVLMLGALVCTACSSSSKSNTVNTPTTTSPSAPARGLVGTTWTLTTYRANGGMKAASTAAVASLSFAALGKLTGSTGCNSFGGTYTATASALTISLANHTLIACPPSLAPQEQAILNQLPSVANYTTTANALTLTDNNKTELFSYAAASTGIKDSVWKVTGVNNGNGAVNTTALTEKLTASFDAGGQFAGFGGCNRLSGPYKLSGNNGLTIGPLVSTLIGCQGDVGELETEYTTALGRVASYEISGTTLTLRDKNGATQVTAQRV
jgi:heat shock protein HslJ